MLATTPPKEDIAAARVAILDLARIKLAPLFPQERDLDALPGWLWSLPAHDIARCLVHDTTGFAVEITDRLESDTARRHPAERFVAYLDRHHPHLSHLQRARLADFTQAFVDLMAEHGVVVEDHMLARGFTRGECDRFTKRADDLIAAVAAEAPCEPPCAATSLAEQLRAAGDLAHARRAFAKGDLEISAVVAGRDQTAPAAAVKVREDAPRHAGVHYAPREARPTDEPSFAEKLAAGVTFAGKAAS